MHGYPPRPALPRVVVGRRPGPVEDVVGAMTANRLAHDLDHVLAQMSGLWEDLRGARLFLTGGTGFFGCWLLGTFRWSNDHLGLDAAVVVLTRNSRAFTNKAPRLAVHPALTSQEGPPGAAPCS